MKRETSLIIILLALLIISFGYIIFEKLKERESFIYQQGMQYGYEQAIIQIVEKASRCEQVPLVVGNQTLNIASLHCMQDAVKSK